MATTNPKKNNDTPVGRYSPSWDAIFNYRDTLNKQSYTQQEYYQDNIPKTSDYEYSSRYQPPSTVVKTQSPSIGAGIGGYAIPKNPSSPTPSPNQSRYNPNNAPSKTAGDVLKDLRDKAPTLPSSPSKPGSNNTPASPSGGGNPGSGSGSGGSTKTPISGGTGGIGGTGGGGTAYSFGDSSKSKQLILGLPVEAQRAVLEDGQSLADLYGIDYNRESIESIFQDATDAAHEANLKEYNRTSRQYYDKLGATQNSLIDTLRKQRAASITSGANAGMQNATELSEILGLTQTVSPDALALAQDRNALVEAYNAQSAQNARDAMEYSDQLKQAIAALASEKYGYDAQQYVAELSHNANVQAQNTASSAAYTGNKYATLEDILGLSVVPSATYRSEDTAVTGEDPAVPGTPPAVAGSGSGSMSIPPIVGTPAPIVVGTGSGSMSEPAISGTPAPIVGSGSRITSRPPIAGTPAPIMDSGSRFTSKTAKSGTPSPKVTKSATREALIEDILARANRLKEY